MILTIETAAALNLLLKGEDAQTPNGDTPHWQVEVVEAVRQSEPGKRMAVFTGLFGARPDYMTIKAQVLGADAKKKKISKFVKLPTYKDGELIPEKKYTIDHYMDVLNQLGYTFRLCTLDDQIEVNNAPIDDITEAVIESDLRNNGLQNLKAALAHIKANAKENSYNPILNYFKSISWDGQDHINKLAGYFTDQHNAFPMILRFWLVGAVAKVYSPIRNRMMILDGPQNIGKSSFVRWLCSPLPKYFYEGPINADAKDDQILLLTTFIWEVSETGSTLRRQDIDALKSFLTRHEVKVRFPYGHHKVQKNAITSFIGTVNNVGGILADPTGNTRYLTVNIKFIDWQGYVTNCNINQVWAQAVHLYHKGEAWEPKAKQLELVNFINDTYEVQDPIIDLISRHFEIDINQNDWFVPTLDVIQVLHDNGWRGGSPRGEAMMLAPAMKKLGLEKIEKFYKNTVLNGYKGLKKRFEPPTS